jgi:hypothetical protein
MRHLRVELDTVEAARRVLYKSVLRIFGRGHGLEPGGKTRDLIAMGIPDAEGPADPVEQVGSSTEAEGAMAILAMGGGSDLAAEHLGHELDAVADAKHGNAEVEQGGVRTGRALGANAGWPPERITPLTPSARRVAASTPKG